MAQCLFIVMGLAMTAAGAVTAAMQHSDLLALAAAVIILAGIGLTGFGALLGGHKSNGHPPA